MNLTTRHFVLSYLKWLQSKVWIWTITLSIDELP